eukprot:6490442-Amphidinium_carterae.3
MKSNQKTGSEHAEGDACLECFTTWQEHVKHLSWATYCERVKDPEDSLKENLVEAMRLKSHPQERKWKAQDVYGVQQCMVELTRSYQALSLGELKKHLGVARVNKDILDKAPQITVMNEAGQEEDLWLFKLDSQPFRQCNIKVQHGCNWNVHQLASSRQSWTEQAADVYKWTSDAQLSEDGTKNLLNKVALLSLCEFKEKASAANVKNDDEDGEGGSSESEVEMKMVGAAAAILERDSGSVVKSKSSKRLKVTPESCKTQRSEPKEG